MNETFIFISFLWFDAHNNGSLLGLFPENHMLKYGEDREVEIRGCTIHAVEVSVHTTFSCCEAVV